MNKTPKKFGSFLMQLAEKSDHVYWLSSPDFQTIEYISPAYEKIWGRKVQELYSTPEKWIAFMHPEDAARYHPIETMKELIKKVGDEARYAADYRIIRPNGEVRWIMDRGFPIYDDQGNCCGVTGVALDVTAEKKAEIALEKSKNAAEAANRAKTEFLANMSHDVRSPMMGVLTFTELMMADSSWRTPKDAKQIHSCTQQVLKFFDSCLELSKMEMSEFESKQITFSLLALLEEIQALFIPRVQSKNLNFHIDHDAHLPKAFLGHRGSLYRVVLNLVGNAVKFTEKGEVNVRTFIAEHLRDNKIRVGIEIKDTGVGIPEDKHKVIFEKLSRLTPSYEGKIEGSGIGLYIVDQYVKHMQGEIKVTSIVGQGSTFTVLLPLEVASESDLPVEQRNKVIIPSTPVVAPTITTPIAAKSASMTPKKLSVAAPLLLLVEDNVMIQIATQGLLNDAGFQVDIAGTGAEALEAFMPGKYAFIYMDIGLPDIQGYEVAAAIRRKEKDLNAIIFVPIIALTAHGSTDIKAFCGNAGMQGVLSKPLTPEQAQAVWQRYGKGESIEVPGLTLLEDSPPLTVAQTAFEKSERPIPVIDLAATIALIGSKTKAKEMYLLLASELTKNYLPQLEKTVKQQDYIELRKLLHSLIGALCYAKAPRLNHA